MEGHQQEAPGVPDLLGARRRARRPSASVVVVVGAHPPREHDGSRARAPSARSLPRVEERPPIGATLREARLRQNLEIAECAAATRIRERYLVAIEDGRFESLPDPAYVNGFVRAYARPPRRDRRRPGARAAGTTTC